MLELSKASEDQAQDICDELYWDICDHDRGLNPATGITIPFLIDLLCDESLKGKVSVINLIRSCVDLVTHREQRLYELVTEGLEVFIKLLDDPNWRVRFVTLHLIAPDIHPKHQQHYIRRTLQQYKLREKRPEIQRSLNKILQRKHLTEPIDEKVKQLGVLEKSLEALQNSNWKIRLQALILIVTGDFPDEVHQRIHEAYYKHKEIEFHPNIKRYFTQLDSQISKNSQQTNENID